MKKQKIQQKIYQQDNDQDSDKQQLGKYVGRRDYISLKKHKVKPLTSNEQNQYTVELYRNQELDKYLQQEFGKENNNLNGHKEVKSNKKVQKGKNQTKVDGKQKIINQVIFNLKNQKNVCLTGGMDKTVIMNQIVDLLQQNEQNVFVIYGYAQPINDKKIYNAFGTHLVNCGFIKNTAGVQIKDQLDQYRMRLLELQEDTIIYVVFYDLSNYGFMNAETQSRLAELFSLPRLRLIASVENCKIALCWSFHTLNMYDFVFVNTNSTNYPITKIREYLPLNNQKSQKTQLQIIQIWKSLNRNQRQIASILAQNQLINISLSANDQNYLSFQQLLDACVQRVILSDDHQLRQNLIQLTDHKVVIQQIDKTKNKKVYIMKLDRRILENIKNGVYDNYEYEGDNK